MKIENAQANRLTQKQAENASEVDKVSRPGGQEKRSETLAGKDRASLSENARLLARARARLDESPQARAEVVDALKGQIANGTYQVPLEELVQRLLHQLKAG